MTLRFDPTIQLPLPRLPTPGLPTPIAQRPPPSKLERALATALSQELRRGPLDGARAHQVLQAAPGPSAASAGDVRVVEGRPYLVKDGEVFELHQPTESFSAALAASQQEHAAVTAAVAALQRLDGAKLEKVAKGPASETALLVLQDTPASSPFARLRRPSVSRCVILGSDGALYLKTVTTPIGDPRAHYLFPLLPSVAYERITGATAGLTSAAKVLVSTYGLTPNGPAYRFRAPPSLPSQLDFLPKDRFVA